MSSTYTPNDGLELMANGDQASAWGSTLNNNFSLIDQGMDGVASISLSSGSYNLAVTNGSLSNGRAKVIVFSGAPGGTAAITISPSNINKVYWIVNQTAQSLVLSNGSGSTLTIAASTTAPAFCDGSGNVIGLQAGNNTFVSLTASTGNFSTLNVTGTANLPAATNVNIASQTLAAYIASVIPSITAMSGSLVVSAIGSLGVSGGNWVVFTLGTTPGSRVQIAYGTGIGGNGYSIPLPLSAGPFVVGQMIAGASIQTVISAAGFVENFTCSQAGGTITITGAGSSGATTLSAAWQAVAWTTGY